jgi:MGT family glycosyltransferase
MTAKHVAILMFPGWGHVNPTLEISRLLVSLGHRVSYVVDERFAAAVADTGARVVGYASRRPRLPSGAVTADDLSVLSMSILRDSIDVVLPRMLAAFAADVPDLILYDLESFAAARAAARRWGRPTAQLFPYVATNEQYSLSSEVFAGAGEVFGECIELVAGFLADEGAEPAALWPFLSNFDDRNLVLLPREFQPLGETFDDRYVFVGHSLAPPGPGVGSWPRPPGAGRVALITLGTEVNDRPGFFARCGDAFAGSDWHLVVAVGPGNLPAGQPAAEHVELHEWLAFETVLPHVSAVVCHSGMSTILQTVSFGKPLVIVTYTPEDRVNARRVTELGLGVEVPGAEATAERLRGAVEAVAADRAIHRRVAALRVAMFAAGGPARAAQVIDDWLLASVPTSGETMRQPAESIARGNVVAR